MSPIALSHSLPLPRGWPHRVRSAVVQVISLARTSLALTQGWASNSMNPQLRRQQICTESAGTTSNHESGPACQAGS
jgi:hypothetical protein